MRRLGWLSRVLQPDSLSGYRHFIVVPFVIKLILVLVHVTISA